MSNNDIDKQKQEESKSIFKDVITEVVGNEEDKKESDRDTQSLFKVRSVYLLPNLITTGALLSGFYGILAAINHDFQRSAICIFVAMLLDGLDGRVARMTNSQSAFGEQYDSIADMLSFGAAPAIIIYQWSLFSVENISWLPEKLSWMIPFIYCACAALRLARFNVEVGSINPKYFIGLPSPSAAGTVVGFVWLGTEYNILGTSVVGFSLVITLLAGLAMVAPIRYFSFKKVHLDGKVPFICIALVMLIFALISINPATVLWVIFTGYAIHGPIIELLRRL